MSSEPIMREPVVRRLDFTLNFFQRILNPPEIFVYFIATVNIFSFILISIFFINFIVYLLFLVFMVPLCRIFWPFFLGGIINLFSRESSRCLVITENFIGYGKKDVEFRLLKHNVNVSGGLAGTYIIRHPHSGNLTVSKKALSLIELKGLVEDAR